MSKTLVGIVTRNDEDNFHLLQTSLNQHYEREFQVIDNVTFLIVNDGQTFPYTPLANEEIIKHPRTKHNSACFNQILRKAVNEDFDHIFILMDNIQILNGDVFSQYIQTAEESGIPLLSFGLSAVPNKKGELQPNSRAIFNYTPTVGVTLNLDTTSSFTYLNKSLVDKIGYFDERYKSILEWADYTYRAVEAGYSTPWGWFADITNSESYLTVNKSNDDLPGLRARIMHAAGLFKHKFQLLPEHLPQVPLDSVKTELKIIKDKNLVSKTQQIYSPSNQG